LQVDHYVSALLRVVLLEMQVAASPAVPERVRGWHTASACPSSSTKKKKKKKNALCDFFFFFLKKTKKSLFVLLPVTFELQNQF
jgi:hypothetical protein